MATTLIYCYGDGKPVLLGLSNLNDADRQAIVAALADRSGREAVLLSALKGVVRVADRQTPEFDVARAAIKASEAALADPPVPSSGPSFAAQFPQLHAAIQCVIRETRGFSERKQEAWCQICRYEDPLGTRLHDPNCSIYELHGAWENALKADPPVGDVPPVVVTGHDIVDGICGDPKYAHLSDASAVYVRIDRGK